MISLSELPDHVLHSLAAYLEAPDILHLISTNKNLYRIGLAASFWKNLLMDKTESVPSTAYYEYKQLYLRQSYCHKLPSVRWLSLRTSMQTPSHREGHGACVLGSNLVVTGGYSDDPHVHVYNLDERRDWEQRITTTRPGFAYGASLTTLDSTRAVRFGGFQSGGYSSECGQVAILTVDNSTALWKIVQMKRSSEFPQDESAWRSYLHRAYHTATWILGQRFLLILGGMQASGSILNPLLLDPTTWTWIPAPIDKDVVAPSPRFGHSVVWDAKRQRVVVFGGGDGSNLLRSGRDNSEVWELSLASEPWTWRLVHNDQHYHPRPEESEVSNRLSPSETLCLGRCHIGHLVFPDTVVLAFGSGRPSTNGLLAYNLKNDCFFRPHVNGPLPLPRFTCASVHLPGYVICHGGYSGQRSTDLGDLLMLDLAPALERTSPLPVNPMAASHTAVSDAETLERRNRLLFNHHGFMAQVVNRAMLADGVEMSDDDDVGAFLNRRLGNGHWFEWRPAGLGPGMVADPRGDTDEDGDSDYVDGS